MSKTPKHEMQPVDSHEELRKLVAHEPRGSWFLDVLERSFDFQRWGFRPTQIDGLKITYDSPQCRVSLSPSFEMYDRETEFIYVNYGRLHAQVGELFIDWQGQRCYAWHNINLPEYYWFLEGATAEEAAAHQRRRREQPGDPRRPRSGYPASGAFQATGRGRELHGIEASAAFAGFTWEYYGDRLFSLFDLKQPKKWEEFRSYLKEYFWLWPHGRFSLGGGPPREQVC